MSLGPVDFVFDTSLTNPTFSGYGRTDPGTSGGGGQSGAGAHAGPLPQLLRGARLPDRT